MLSDTQGEILIDQTVVRKIPEILLQLKKRTKQNGTKKNEKKKKIFLNIQKESLF